MNAYVSILSLIYFLAFFCWLRYLYRHSLRTAEDRIYTWQRVSQLIVYVPLGLQAAFLFCYAVMQFFPVGYKFTGLFNKLVLHQGEKEYPDFAALKILFTGSLIVAFSYLLTRAVRFVEDKPSALFLKTVLFAGHLIMLKTTVQNIYLHLDLHPSGRLLFSYQNNYLWLFSILLVLFLLVFSGKQNGKVYDIRYPALAARVLAAYCLLSIILMLWRIIYLVIEKAV